MSESVFKKGARYIADILGLEFRLTSIESDVGASQTALNEHVGDTANPHLTTAEQTGAVPLSQAGIAYPPLVGGKIPSQYMPDESTVVRLVVNSQAEMLASGLQAGDAVIRTDDGGRTWKLYGNNPTVLANWLRQTDDRDAPVQSVNAMTGTVLIDDGNLSTQNPANANIATSLRATLTAIYNTIVLGLSLCANRTLSNLTDYTQARINMGLGDSATRNVGIVAGTVATGDDHRFPPPFGSPGYAVLPSASFTSGNMAFFTTPNQIYVTAIHLNLPLSVNKILLRLNALSVGGFCAVSLWNFGGTQKLLDSGPISTNTADIIVSIPTANLSSGYYLLAWTMDNSTARFAGDLAYGVGVIRGVMSPSGSPVITGISNLFASSGVFPATLGNIVLNSVGCPLVGLRN